MDLIDIAKQVNEHHAAAIVAKDESLRQARHCGEALVKAKRMLKHGEFTSWIAANCSVGRNQANRYMQFAKHSSLKCLPEETFQEMSIKEAIVTAKRAPVVRRHPLSEFMPRQSEQAISRLRQDIEKDGAIDEPGLVYEGMLLDGWSRYQVSKELGLPMRWVSANDIVFEPQPGDEGVSRLFLWLLSAYHGARYVWKKDTFMQRLAEAIPHLDEYEFHWLTRLVPPVREEIFWDRCPQDSTWSDYVRRFWDVSDDLHRPASYGQGHNYDSALGQYSFSDSASMEYLVVPSKPLTMYWSNTGLPTVSVLA